MRAAPAAWTRRSDWRSPSSLTPPSCLRWRPDCARPALYNVETSIIADSGHWVAEEQPAEVAAAIDRLIATT